MINAVIVDGDVSYPATSGKRLRTLNLMLRLAQRHKVTYIARNHGMPGDADEARQFLEDHGIRTLIVNHPLPRKAGPMFYLRLAGNLLSPVPYSVATHTSLPMRRAIEQFAADNPVDVWQFEWTPYLNALRDPAACKVLIAHNVDSLIWQRYHETARGWLKRCYVREQWRKFESFERRAFAEASRVVAVSPQDAALIRDRFGQTRVDVVENGIDRPYFEAMRGQRDPRVVLFLGALDWRPNLDAVDFLLRDIFPRLRAQIPDARVWIVGRRPPAGLPDRVKAMAGAELHADVDDVRPFLGNSGVMVVPLRIGGGSRLKILEALACGLPVVSTTIGAEGLELDPGKDILVADTGQDLARVLADCLQSPAPCQAMAMRARSSVLERYDWDILATKLESVWEAACGLAHTNPR